MISAGSITMMVSAIDVATANLSVWTIRQRYLWAGGVVPVLHPTPDEVEVNDTIGLASPTMSIIGVYPSTPVQVTCNVTAHATLTISWSVRFQTDQCGR